VTALTARQRETLRHIQSYFVTLKRPPTYRELAAMLGHISTNAVNDLLGTLERKGAIRRGRAGKTRGISRGIQLVTDNCPYCGRSPVGAAVRS
jgi:SOS-response transcriptional repressor LexA